MAITFIVNLSLFYTTMKVIIYNAISIDGYIARTNSKTDWVSETDWNQFKKLVKTSKAIVMGSNTYKQSGDDFPYDCELNVVMTSQKELLKQNENKGIIFTNKNPKEVIKIVKNMGFKQLLIIGVGKLNASFLKKNLVDELIVDIHPIILGSGIKLFDANSLDVWLKKVESHNLEEGLLCVKYSLS